MPINRASMLFSHNNDGAVRHKRSNGAHRREHGRKHRANEPDRHRYLDKGFSGFILNDDTPGIPLFYKRLHFFQKVLAGNFEFFMAFLVLFLHKLYNAEYTPMCFFSYYFFTFGYFLKFFIYLTFFIQGFA